MMIWTLSVSVFIHFDTPKCKVYVYFATIIPKFTQCMRYTKCIKGYIGQLWFLWAVKERKTDIVEFLLSVKEDLVDSKDNNGTTAFQFARLNGDSETVKILEHSKQEYERHNEYLLTSNKGIIGEFFDACHREEK